MGRVAVSRFFNAPQDQVFSVLTDLETAAERIQAIKSMEILTDGPVGRGTRFRETRVMFGKEATEEMEITEWSPPERYVTEAHSCGSHYICMISCTPDGDGTRVDMSFDARPEKLMAKIMMPLMGWMMTGMCRKAFEKDLDDIQRSIEGASPASA